MDWTLTFNVVPRPELKGDGQDARRSTKGTSELLIRNMKVLVADTVESARPISLLASGDKLAATLVRGPNPGPMLIRPGPG